MYHRILPKSDRRRSFSHEAIMVEPQRFRAQIQFLQKHFHLATAEEIVEHFEKNKPFKRPTCLISFDDAWQDNYQYAFPILQEYKTPALIFVPVDYIETGNLFWQERMGHGFQQLVQMNTAASNAFLAEHHLLAAATLDNNEQMQRIVNWVREYKSLPDAEIVRILARQDEILGRDIHWGAVDRYLSWEQIRSMQQQGIDFGSHACSHRLLTRLTESEVHAELSESKRKIEEKLNSSISTIAYPNGNHSLAIRNIASETGYKIGFGTEYGYLSHEEDRFDIKRMNMNDSTASSNPMLLAMMLGLA